MIVGLRLVWICGFGVQKANLLWKSHCADDSRSSGDEDTHEEGETPGLSEGSASPTTPVTSPGCRVDERETLLLAESKSDPLLNARVWNTLFGLDGPFQALVHFSPAASL